MTIVQALTAAIQVPGIDDITLEKACIDASLTTTDTYVVANEKVVDLAAVNVLQGLVLQSVSESGFSFSLSKEALQKRIVFLRNKWGITDAATDSQPKVRSPKVW